MIRRYDRRQQEHYVNQLELDQLEDQEIENEFLETGIINTDETSTSHADKKRKIIELDPIDPRDINNEDAIGTEEDSMATATNAREALRQALQGGGDDRNDE